MRVRWVVVSLVMAVGLAGCDWPMFMQNAAHSGASRDTSISVNDARGLGERWSAALGTTSQANVPSSPVVSSGVVYLGTQDGRLVTFDARGRVNCSGAPKTCVPLWTSTVLGRFSGTPAVVGGRVFIGSTDGRLYAFDAAGNTNCGGAPKVCQPLWRSIVVGAINSSPVVAKGKVYVGSDDHNVYAFDVSGAGCGAAGCAPLFTHQTGGIVGSSPALSGDLLYVGSDDGKLSVFDANGSQRCNAAKVCQPLFVGPTGGAVRSSPSVADGRVFVGSSDFKLYAFDADGTTNCAGSAPATCTPLWTATTSNTVLSSPAIAKGVVYIGTVAGGSSGARLHAYDAVGSANCSGGATKTCQPLWTSNNIGTIALSPISVANDVVYINVAVGITSFVNTVFAFDATAPTGLCSGTPKICNPVWSQASSGGDPSGSAPAVSDGVVYVAGARLHAFAVNADYRFQENFATSIGAAPDLEPVGTTTCVESFHTESVEGVNQPVYCLAQGEGLSLYPASPTVTSTVYSMVAQFRFDAVSGYRRIFDVKLGTDDAGLYVREGKLVFFPVVEGASATIAAGDWVQVVLTRDSAKTVTGYVNGVQQFQFTDSSDNAVLLLDGTSQYAMRWFIDNTTGGGSGEESGGAVARIRVWNRALGAAEVSGL